MGGIQKIGLQSHPVVEKREGPLQNLPPGVTKNARKLVEVVVFLPFCLCVLVVAHSWHPLKYLRTCWPCLATGRVLQVVRGFDLPQGDECPVMYAFGE